MIVIGDKIIDKYIIGKSTRLSPEAPVPVIYPQTEEVRPGGAYNVVENLKILGSNAYFIFNDKQATTKTRIIANGQIVCRLDAEHYEAFDAVDELQNLFGDVSEENVVLVDYNKGVLHDPKRLIKYLNDKNCTVYVDAKKRFEAYEGAFLIKCNEKEFAEFTGHIFDPKTVDKVCFELCMKYYFVYIVVTLGSAGCYYYNIGLNEGRFVPVASAEKKNVIDVTGAGDVFMAALVHYHSRMYDIQKSAQIANSLASISVGHMGTYIIGKDDIASVVKNDTVFTNGCFDILHPGHIHLLKESKKLGDKLIVGLNSDASVRRLKGNSRPILNQTQRKAMLEALDIADEVIIFDEDTPIELIKKIKPDIITKGGDYVPKEVVGHVLAQVVIIPTIEGYSTTGVINEIARKN